MPTTAALRSFRRRRFVKLLSTRERASGSGFIWEDGEVADQPAFATTVVPSATMLRVYWPSVVLASRGRGLELAIDPYTAFKDGRITVRAIATVDVGATVPAAILKSASIT